jgi:transcriptional regulator with XRE-family HTH domain
MPAAEPDPIAPRLKRARQGAGISRDQLAQLLPVGESHLRNVENGHRRLTPTLAQQIRDALLALGVQPSDLPSLGDD